MLYNYNIKDENFLGILKLAPGNVWQDPLALGRYPVWIPEIMWLGGYNTIWAHNWTQGENYATFIRPSTKEKLSQGKHNPLIEGMRVMVSFLDDHMQTCYIKRVVPRKVKVPLEATKNRDPMYLEEKTEKETWNFIHDKKKYFHHLHGGGRNNFTIENHNKDKMGRITLQVSHPLNDGINGVKPITTIEMQDKHAVVELVKHGHHKMVMDPSGILLDIFKSDTIIKMDGEGIRMETIHNIYMMAQKNIDIIAQQYLKMSGKIETHIRGNIVRITGNQQLCLNGTIVVSQAVINNYVKSGVNTRIESDIKDTIIAPIIEIIGSTNLHLEAPITSIESDVIATESSLLSNNADTIAQDSLELVAMGAASGTSPGVVSASKALGTSTDAAAAAGETAVGMTDTGSAIASASMVEISVPCKAEYPDEKIRYIDPRKPFGRHISPKVKYVRKLSELDKKQAVDELKKSQTNGGPQTADSPPSGPIKELLPKFSSVPPSLYSQPLTTNEQQIINKSLGL